MIEAAVIGTTPPRADPSAPGRDDASTFSFAAAVSAMETQAARSLEAHGATPDKGAAIGETGAQARQEPRSAHAATDRNAAQTSERAPSAKSEPASPAGAPQSQSSPNSAAPAPAPQLLANPAVTAPQVAAAPIPAQGAAATIKADAAAIRAADIAKATAPKEAKAPAPAHKPDAPTQDFAKLLARRLDAGATQFELRLDPPSLGRVEAHLKLADDGKNVLALKFEHQAALDLFANDEAALRNALDSSGFQFTNENVVFELADETDAAAFGAQSAHVYEPFYAAPWSSGAVDISI